jgi:pyruvate/2-oxoglutarate/acetoin dehydrogenase E1 component
MTEAEWLAATEIAARIADAYFDELDAPIRRLNGIHPLPTAHRWKPPWFSIWKRL